MNMGTLSHRATAALVSLAVAAGFGGALLMQWRSRRRPRRRRVAANLGLCLDDHLDLEAMDVRQFVIHPAAQQLLLCLQSCLLEEPYASFGRTAESPERFNIVLPSTFGSDRRKPVTAEFQRFCEEIYWPLASALLFGTEASRSLAPHLTSIKINMLRSARRALAHSRTFQTPPQRTRTRTARLTHATRVFSLPPSPPSFRGRVLLQRADLPLPSGPQDRPTRSQGREPDPHDAHDLLVSARRDTRTRE